MAWEGADAVEAYCMREGGLNASQAGAVLVAAAPSAVHGIALIQVGTMQMLMVQLRIHHHAVAERRSPRCEHRPLHL